MSVEPTYCSVVALRQRDKGIFFSDFTKKETPPPWSFQQTQNLGIYPQNKLFLLIVLQGSSGFSSSMYTVDI
jgi:hypothetical protein